MEKSSSSEDKEKKDINIPAKAFRETFDLMLAKPLIFCLKRFQNTIKALYSIFDEEK